MMQPVGHLCHSLLDSVKQIYVPPLLGTPELVAALQVGSHTCRVEGPFPSLSCWSHCIWCSPGCSWLSGLQVHIDLSCWASHPWTFQSPSPQSCFPSTFCPACICARGCSDPGSWPYTWPCWTLWDFHRSTSQTCQGPFGFCIPSFHHVDCTTQLGVISKFTENELDPTVYVTDKDVKWCWS